jgi:hypothetical protein
MGLTLHVYSLRRSVVVRCLDAIQAVKVYVCHFLFNYSLKYFQHTLHLEHSFYTNTRPVSNNRRSSLRVMALYLSKTTLFSILITSSFTSARVVPRGARPVIPTSDEFDGSGQHYYPSGYQGTEYPHLTTITNLSSMAPETSSLSTSCNTLSTVTVTLSGSSIVPLASETGNYPTTTGSTIYGQEKVH